MSIVVDVLCDCFELKRTLYLEVLADMERRRFKKEPDAKPKREDKGPMCCCEYVDHTGKDNHVLACCCDCNVLDHVVDRLLACDKIPDSTWEKMFTTIEDRLRIPWFNGKGAIKVNLDVAIPAVVVPLGILLGTLHLALTILVMVFIPLTLYTTYKIWQKQKRKTRTKLFYAWGFTSVIQMYITFECVVVAYRKILLWENMLLHTSIIIMFYAFYHVKKDPGIIRRSPSQEMLDRVDEVRESYAKENNHSIKKSSYSHSHQSGDSKAQINEKCANDIENQNDSMLEGERSVYNVAENTYLQAVESEQQGDGDSADKDLQGPVTTFMMHTLGFSKDVLRECVEDQKRREKESQHVIPAEAVNWVDSRMIPDGRVTMWCKTCRLVKPFRTGHCPVCNVCVQGRDHHCLWIDNCIGANNHRAFLLGIIFFLISGIYGIQLTLSSLCTPVIYWDWFLIPNDCRYLYADFPTALSFVSCVYSICAVTGISAALVTQCILISQNITSHEMHTASFRNWIQNYVCVHHNSQSRGFFKNWKNFILGERKTNRQNSELLPSSGCQSHSCNCV